MELLVDLILGCKRLELSFPPCIKSSFGTHPPRSIKPLKTRHCYSEYQRVQHSSPKGTLQVYSAQVYNVHCHSAHCVLCTVLLCKVQCWVRWVGALCSVTNYFLCIVPYHNPCPPKQKISFVCFQIFSSHFFFNFVYSENQDLGYLIYP